MNDVEFLSVILVLIVWAMSLYCRRTFLISWRVIFFLAPVALLFYYLFFLMRHQYVSWLHDEITRYLLPPYADVSYFLYYSFTHYFFAPMISFFIASITLIIVLYLNHWRRGTLFFKEEPYFLAVALFLSGHPGWIWYGIILFSVTFIYALVCWVVTRKIHRISYYHFWLPCAAISLAAHRLFLIFDWYTMLFIVR